MGSEPQFRLDPILGMSHGNYNHDSQERRQSYTT
jgi:hypothetical protein